MNVIVVAQRGTDSLLARLLLLDVLCGWFRRGLSSLAGLAGGGLRCSEALHAFAHGAPAGLWP